MPLIRIEFFFFWGGGTHSDEGLTLESFTVANLPYRPCG